ncbi:hypothetical protein TNCT6_71790 [Streptomyces sp. 6-11-2]|nr:hypothetical protein TNCT6_71790 [Streptomyces sp. 6-11-2]
MCPTVVIDDEGGAGLRASPGGCQAVADRQSVAGVSLVAALADHWGTVPYPPSGKTVGAELLDTTTSA